MSVAANDDRILSNRAAERPEAGTSKRFALNKAQVAAVVGLGLIVLLGSFLRFYQLGAYSIGNAYYAMGDLRAAEQSFAEATRQFPTEGAAFNNLAQVLFDQGKKKAALPAAEKAVSLGGPMSGVFQETLEEIKSNLNQP